MADHQDEVEMEVKRGKKDSHEPKAAKRLKQHLAAVAVSIGAVGTGTTLGWTSVANPALQCSANISVTTDEPCYDDSELSWVAACMALGALVAALPVGQLVDVLGRKGTGLCLAPPFAAGWACLAWGNSLAWLCVGRLLTGAMGGAFNVLAPIYIAEVAQKEIRGALCGYFQLFLTIGTLYVYLLGLGAGLFWTSLGCGLVPIVFFAAFALVPETPLYQLRRGKDDEARSALQWFRGPDYDVEPEIVEAKAALEGDRKNKVSLRKAFGTRAAQRGIIIGLGLIVCFQLSGINAVLFYTSDIFKSAAGSAIAPEVSAVIVGVMQVVATLASSLVVDWLGRRILLVLSDAVMALCTLLLGVFFFLDSQGQADGLSWLPLASLCLFVVAFSLGLGPVTWILLGEMYTPNVKGIAGSLCCLLNWLLTFLVTKFFTDLNIAFGIHVTFWSFAVISALGTVFIFSMVPETKDRSLEEVQRQLSGESRK